MAVSGEHGIQTPTVDVLVSVPLEADLVVEITRVSPRVRVRHDPGSPSAGALAGAEVLLGVPGNSGEGLSQALRAGRCLRWVAATIAGAGELVSEAVRLGPLPASLIVTRAAAVHDVPLAEFCALGMLAFRKDLTRLQEDKHARCWPQRRATPELNDATVVILGLGGVGRRVARLASALGMHVVGVRRSPDDPVAYVDELYPVSMLPELAPRADVMVVTLPLTPETAGLVDRQTIARLRPDAVFINVGRGRVVDEAALVEALQDGQLAGAALDVFATEPLPTTSPLWTQPNVILSPHTAALSPRENERMVAGFCTNLRAYLDGGPMFGVVDPSAGY